ncbi:BON domain-containing protein [Acidobacteria bacterium AB60]|nr:BON domain-containing protein [Acidobacteria bacterium AB60]
MKPTARTNGTLAVIALAIAVLFAAGCKQQAAAKTDQQLTTDIQAKIQGERALAPQNIQISVNNGVATLNGTVTDEASRALAANDSGTVPGVKTVINNLTVQSAATGTQPAPAAAAQAARDDSKPSPGSRAADNRKHRPDRHEQAAPAPAPPPQVASNPDPAPVQAPAPAPAPPPAPKPVVKQVTLPAGTTIPIRITETIDSKTAQANDVFHGSLAGDLGTQGVIAIPHGAEVVGRIVDAREAAHFKGAALLSLELTQLVTRGQKLTLVTDAYTKEAAGRGKNTAEKAGGGAVLGAIIGGLAGGGKGAAIGGLAGAGAGTGINAATHGQQVVIPTETLINFQLQSPITLTVTLGPNGGQADDQQDPQLQQRQP